MGKKKIFDMGRSFKADYKHASHPDEEDPFGIRDGIMPGKNPRWLYMADLVVSIIKSGEDPDRGVYVIKSRYGVPGRMNLRQIVDMVIELLKVEFDLNIGFFEDVVAQELRGAIMDVLSHHKVLPKKDWNKIMK